VGTGGGFSQTTNVAESRANREGRFSRENDSLNKYFIAHSCYMGKSTIQPARDRKNRRKNSDSLGGKGRTVNRGK